MRSFVVVILATLAVYSNAHGHGAVLSGPSGVVTNHGAVGPAGHSDDGDDGQWHGDGGQWHGDGGGHYSDVVSTHGAQLVGASVFHNEGAHQGWSGHSAHGVVVRGPHTVPATIVGPAGKVHADGLWGPVHSAHGHGWANNGAQGWAGHGAHGVVVRGPHTVPATIVGPAGKVHADGLWGPIHAAHGHGWANNGAQGWAGHGAHGVVVRGPHTVPATIVGPSGKVHADGLWGPHHGHHY